MKKQHFKNLALNKKSISKLSALGLAGGEADYENTVIVCLKTKPFHGGNLCFKTMNQHCWQTEVVGCGVPNTYQVNTDTVALC